MSTIINPSDLEINIAYVVTHYMKLRDRCDWYYLIKIEQALDSSQQKILRITNRNCYVYDKITDIISGKITLHRLVISNNILTGEITLHCGGDIEWKPLPLLPNAQ